MNLSEQYMSMSESLAEKQLKILIKKLPKGFKNFDLVANNGIKDELHFDTDTGLHFQVRYDKWYKIPFINSDSRLRKLLPIEGHKLTSFDMLSLDKIIDVVTKLRDKSK